MRKILPWLFLGVAAVPAMPADFEAGMAAYRAGNYETAMQEWLPLAESGSPAAQFNVGLLYDRGKGVPEDRSVAVEWFDRAAELGFARAQYRLAEIHESGDGVEQDYSVALKWYRIAGKQRFRDARKRGKRLADKMNSTQIAYAEMYIRQWRQRRKERAKD